MMPLKDADLAFVQRYASHLKHLKLQGLQTKTVDRLRPALATAWATATSMVQTTKKLAMLVSLSGVYRFVEIMNFGNYFTL
jgi:hypothetical protein